MQCRGRRVSGTRSAVPGRTAGTRSPPILAPPPPGSEAAFANPPAPQSSEAAAAAAASPALRARKQLLYHPKED